MRARENGSYNLLKEIACSKHIRTETIKNQAVSEAVPRYSYLYGTALNFLDYVSSSSLAEAIPFKYAYHTTKFSRHARKTLSSIPRCSAYFARLPQPKLECSMSAGLLIWKNSSWSSLNETTAPNPRVPSQINRPPSLLVFRNQEYWNVLRMC